MRYFDLHCDTITECALRQKELLKNDLHIAIDRAESYRLWAQFFAVWIPDTLRGAEAAARFDTVYDVFISQLKQNHARIAFCKTGPDLSEAEAEGRHAAFLSIEGSACLCGSLDRLTQAYQNGVRMITLTWNGRCEAGDGCMVPSAGGLTPFGIELIQSMQRLNMLVDVSHLSRQGFWDVAKSIDAPLVASHSDAAAVCAHPRNLDDRQFAEVVRRRGLVGLNLYPDFLIAGHTATVNDVLPHIDHFLSLGGQDVLSVGCDFDGAQMPQGINGIQDMTKLYRLLTKRYGLSIADKIFYKNASDFIKRTLTE